MTGHHEPAQAEAVLNHLILQLDEQLSKNNTPFLLGSSATSADFSIWSFLAQDRTTLKLSKVHDWFNRVAAEPCIKVNCIKHQLFESLFHRFSSAKSIK